MSDLTEKWKSGELEDGFYYTQTGKEQIIAIDMYDKESNIWLLNSDKDMPPFEVLAKVPSYEELQALRQENARLKELLKECKAKTSELLKKYAELDQDCSYEHGQKWSEQEFK